MQRWRSFRPIVLWIAVWALLFGALSPALAQVVQRQSGRTAIVQCALMAPVQMASPDASGHHASHSTAPAHAFEHCPYCALHAAALGPQPATPQFVAVVLAQVLQLADTLAPLTALRWPDRQSRGPPASA